MDKKPSKLSILTKGIIKENPVLVLLLGTCPTLATTSSAINGIGMGVSATAVLICSNIVISLLRKIIPDKVRIPCYIVVIAGFVTVVQLMLQAFVPSLYDSLGLFIPLIVVNCIILGRAEMFASKNNPFDSALDGIGMGIGFTLALGIMGLIREFFGSGTLFGVEVLTNIVPGMGIFNLAPGGFFVFGVLIAAVNYFTKGKGLKKKDFGCEGCAMAAMCGGARKEKECEKGAEEAC
ncbi:MAG: electron transport complex subunit RsxE [Emergencia sp.]